MYWNRVLEGIGNRALAQTAGRQGEERHEALYLRWQQLQGMTELAMLLGVDPALQQQLQGLQDELRDRLCDTAESG